ncbi:MAG: SdpI family protein [Agriterribacter sp.]
MKQILKYVFWVIAICPFGYLAMIWGALPAEIPMHFNIQGEPDRYGNKTELLWMVVLLTALNIGVFYLITNAYKLDSRKKYSEENKAGIQKLAFAVGVFLSAITLFVMHSINRSSQGLVSKPNFVFSAVGLLFCIIGNYMYSIKPNSVAGFRIGTTLKNEENWKRTHQLAGKLWFWGGILVAIACALLPAKTGFIVFMAVTALLTAVPIVYSLKLDLKKESNSGN